MRQTVISFQSSPVPEDGCNLRHVPDTVAVPGFNPHPSRRTGATLHSWVLGLTGLWVSILTRPGGRVQQHGTSPTVIRPSFNPHPSRRTGATDAA